MSTSEHRIDWTKPLRNSGKIFAGRLAQVIMGFGYVALSTHILGVEDFGLLVLIHGLIFGIGTVFQMQSWQGLIKYGAEALKDNDVPRFQALLKFTSALDLIVAIIVFSVLNITLNFVLIKIQIPDHLIDITKFYSFGLFAIMLMPTPQGVLRLLDRFDILGLQAAIDGFIRLSLTIALFVFGITDVKLYLVAWFFGMSLSRVILYIFAVLELQRAGYLFGITKKSSHKEKGLWHFIITNSGAQSFNISQEYIGLILSAALLGPAASGLFKIATQFADLLTKPAREFLMPAIYPEFAKLQAAGNLSDKAYMLFKVMMFITFTAISFFLFLALFGYLLIKYVFGVAYVSAYVPMLWLAGAGFIHVLTSPLEPLLATQGHVMRIFIAYSGSTLIFTGAFYILVQIYGLPGAGIAMIASSLFSLIILACGLKKFMIKADQTIKDRTESA